MNDKSYFVYIVTNKPRGTLYIGITNNLLRRVYEHKNERGGYFTGKYKLKFLVHFEVFNEVSFAIQREKNLKHWVRDWKIDLIEKTNPEWADLSIELW